MAIDPNLVKLAETKAGDPPVLEGSTPAERLAAAQADARAILLKYVDNLDDYDLNAARANIEEVESWCNGHNDELQTSMKAGNDLPSALQLSLGSAKAQSFILSLYSVAVNNAAVHLTGSGQRAVEQQLVIDGTQVTATLMNRDLASRFNAFQLIRRMEETGALAKIFRQPGATQGFGIAPVIVWAIVVVTVALFACVTYAVVSWKQIETNAKLIESICKGDKDPGGCLQKNKDLVKPQGLIEPIKIDLTPLVTVGAIGLGLWLAVKVYGAMPDKRSSRAVSRSPSRSGAPPALVAATANRRRRY